MMNRFKKMMRSEEGQGMTEYIIIVALIAIAAIGVITLFGQNIKALFSASAGVLGGDQNATTSKYGADKAVNKAQKRQINDFGKTNQIN